MNNMLCNDLKYFLCLLYIFSGLKQIICATNEETCYSYAGGSVYPAGAKHVGHKLQTTKAVSKFLISLSLLSS